MRQGEIYLVNFDPSVGREYKKVRPALILQQLSDDENSPYITVMPISSKVEQWRPPDIFLPKDDKNRLLENSVIKVRQISSFDKQRFIKRIGEVNSPIIRKVRGYIRKHFQI